jgi:hypothetical protein
VAAALDQNAWMRDIVGALTVSVLLQYVEVRERMEAMVLNHSTLDATIWHWCGSGLYSVRLAYSSMFIGQSELQGARYLWKVKAPVEFMFFFWLALQGRFWISEHLHCRGLASDASCTLCSQAEESADHLLLGWVVSSPERCGHISSNHWVGRISCPLSTPSWAFGGLTHVRGPLSHVGVSLIPWRCLSLS